MKKHVYLTLTVLALSPMLHGCAVGAASAAYALQAKTADGLSSEAEDKIIEKVKKAVLLEADARYVKK